MTSGCLTPTNKIQGTNLWKSLQREAAVLEVQRLRHTVFHNTTATLSGNVGGTRGNSASTAKKQEKAEQAKKALIAQIAGSCRDTREELRQAEGVEPEAEECRVQEFTRPAITIPVEMVEQPLKREKNILFF